MVVGCDDQAQAAHAGFAHILRFTGDAKLRTIGRAGELVYFDARKDVAVCRLCAQWRDGKFGKALGRRGKEHAPRRAFARAHDIARHRHGLNLKRGAGFILQCDQHLHVGNCAGGCVDNFSQALQAARRRADKVLTANVEWDWGGRGQNQLLPIV